MATPLDCRIFTFTQPDGSDIQLRGWGDQNYAVFETLDGFTVTKNPATGYYEVAQSSADGHALEPAPGAGERLDGAAAGVPPGLGVRRESALDAGRRSALHVSGRRCDQRREERPQQQRMIRATAAAAGPKRAPPQRQTVGDIAAFWELWTLYQQQLFFICLRYMGNAHADAEDALSQVREKARHMLPRAAGVRDPKAWLTRVAVNQCIDIQRNQQRHRRQTVHLDASDADDLLAAVAYGVLPAHNLVLCELKTAIDRAIHALPTLMRDASILYFLEERSYQEIAADLNISYANARKRIQKARTILRASLDHRDQLPFGQNTL